MFLIHIFLSYLVCINLLHIYCYSDIDMCVTVCSRLRTLLKTAKKKLRDQDVGGAEFVSPMSSLRMDQGRHSQAEGAFGRIKDKVCPSTAAPWF